MPMAVPSTLHYYEDSDYFDKGKAVFLNLGSPFQKYRINKVRAIYSPQKMENVVDLGCGWGTFCFALSPLCRFITGVDSSRKAIALCNQALAEKGLKNIRFVCSDIQHTGLVSDAYDCVILADVAEHLYPQEFERVLEESSRLLKKGGRLIVWTPCQGHIFEKLKKRNIILKRDITHVDYKTMEGIIRDVQKNNFTVAKAYYVESHVPVLNLIERALMAVLPILRRRIAVLASKN